MKRNAFLPDWLDRLIQDDGDVARWYATPLSNIAGHARLRDATPAVPLGGEELAEWSEFLRPHEPGPAIGHQLARLADPRALAVVTGQQAGLFGGPLYTLYKVFGAIHLARRLERELARPVVPLFWVASDDHDFAEVAVHSWLDGEGRLRSWRLPENPAEAGMAIWRRSLTPEMLAPFIEEFAASLPVSGFANDTIEFVRGIAHAPGLSLESQFIRCLLAWTRGTGLVPFAPRMPWLRRRAAALVRREIESPGATAALLVESGRELSALGAKAHVLHRTGREANFFLEVDGIRGKVEWDGPDQAVVTHPVHGNILRTAAREELAAGIEQSPECFSPNAALRPIVQDFALPVVAYMGGPSEVLYHAQIGPLYGHFGVFRPAVVPRPSAILVEPRIRRFADKLRVNIRHAVEGGPDSVMAAAARAATAGGLQSAARDHLAKASGAIQQLETALAALTSDTGVVKAAEKLRRGFEESSAKLLERVESHALRADQETASQAQRLSEALWPGGEPQERVVGALSPLMRTTGLDGPSRVGELLDPDPAAMQVIELANLQSASG